MNRNSRRGECILLTLGCGCLAVCALAIVGCVALYFLWGSYYSTDPGNVERAAQVVLPGVQAMPACHKAKVTKIGRFGTWVTLGDTAAGDTYAVTLEAKPSREDPAKYWDKRDIHPAGGDIDAQLVDVDMGGRHETVVRRLENGHEAYQVGLMGHGQELDLKISTRSQPFDREGIQHFLDGLNLAGYTTFTTAKGDRLRYYKVVGKPLPVNGVELGASRAQVEKLLGTAPQQAGNRLLFQAGQIMVDMDDQNNVREVVGQSAPGVAFATKVATLGQKVEPITFLDQVEKPGTFLRTEDGQVTRIVSRR